jgi:hypothetical protein
MCCEFFCVFPKLGKFSKIFRKKWEYGKFFLFSKIWQEFSPNKNHIDWNRIFQVKVHYSQVD